MISMIRCNFLQGLKKSVEWVQSHLKCLMGRFLTPRFWQLKRSEEILQLREENFNIDPSEENSTKLDQARNEYETLHYPG